MYNGWTNHETWLASLELVNCFEIDITDTQELAEYLECYVKENNPIRENGLYNDLLIASFSKINYIEIAEHILEA
jgi:hypothetical protein